MAANEELTESGGRLPQATEEVHLPDPSYLPVLVASGTTIALIGVVTFPPAAVIGLIILIWSSVKWIRQTRSEMRELPLEH